MRLPGYNRRNPVALPKNWYIRDESQLILFLNTLFNSSDHFIAFKTSGAGKEDIIELCCMRVLSLRQKVSIQLNKCMQLRVCLNSMCLF